MITLSTGSLFAFKLEKIFQIAHQAGYSGIELLLENKDKPRADDYYNIDYLKKLEKKYKIKIISIHPVPGLDVDYTPYFNESIKIAQKINAKYIIIHIPKKTRPNYIKWFNKFYLRHFGNKSVTCLTENMGQNAIYDDLKNFQEFPNLCFDIAHAKASKINVIKTVALLNNIKEFHVSDYDGQTCHMSILKNKTFFQKILSIHKKPIKCVELKMPAYKNIQDINDIINTLKETRQFLEQFEEL